MSGERSIAAVQSDVKSVSEEPPIPAPRKINDCKFCGYDHVKGKCPACGKDCHVCGGKNHFLSKCNRKEVNSVSSKPPTMSMNDLFLGMISSRHDMPRGWFKTYNLYCGLNTESVNFKVDKGADADVLPLSQARSLSAPIISSEARLRSYSGDLLPSGGKTTLCLDKNSATKLEFELVDAQVVPILGLKACVELGIVKRIDNLNNQAILDEFSDCFEGICCFKRETHNTG